MKDKFAFLVDFAVIKEVIEEDNKNKATELLDSLELSQKKEIPMQGYTTQSALLRGIYLADEKSSLKQLKRLIHILKIIPSHPNIDFKDEKQVIEEIVKVANLLSGEKIDN